MQRKSILTLKSVHIQLEKVDLTKEHAHYLSLYRRNPD